MSILSGLEEQRLVAALNMATLGLVDAALAEVIEMAAKDCIDHADRVIKELMLSNPEDAAFQQGVLLKATEQLLALAIGMAAKRRVDDACQVISQLILSNQMDDTLQQDVLHKATTQLLALALEMVASRRVADAYQVIDHLIRLRSTDATFQHGVLLKATKLLLSVDWLGSVAAERYVRTAFMLVNEHVVGPSNKKGFMCSLINVMDGYDIPRRDELARVAASLIGVNPDTIPANCGETLIVVNNEITTRPVHWEVDHANFPPVESEEY